MAKNYVGEGDVLNFVAAAAVLAGAGVLIGKRVGVSLADVAAGATGVASVTGVYSLPKLSTDAVAQGDLLYWDNTNKRLTVTATANTLAGYAAAASAAGVASVDIKINA